MFKRKERERERERELFKAKPKPFLGFIAPRTMHLSPQ
jgi:hypothetical protein